MRALVTGATGMVGRHIAQRLLNDGWTVRAMVRRTETVDARALNAMGIALAKGDVLDQPSFVAAAHDCDVVFHAAAQIFARDWDTYMATNVDGTRNAISAAASAHARLVHISSVAVYGAFGRYDALAQGKLTSEDLPLPPLEPHSYYARSKRESEALALGAHQTGRVWATAVRPDVIYGPHDRQFVPRLARLLRLGVMPLLAGGRATLAVVHAANVADGAVRAAVCDVAGGRAYNLTNDFDVSAREFFTWGAQGLGVNIHFVPVPVAPTRMALGTLSATVSALSLGRLRVPSGVGVNFLVRGNPFTSERARAELGWQPPVHPSAGVVEAFAWRRRMSAAR